MLPLVYDGRMGKINMCFYDLCVSCKGVTFSGIRAPGWGSVDSNMTCASSFYVICWHK